MCYKQYKTKERGCLGAAPLFFYLATCGRYSSSPTSQSVARTQRIVYPSCSMVCGCSIMMSSNRLRQPTLVFCLAVCLLSPLCFLSVDYARKGTAFFHSCKPELQEIASFLVNKGRQEHRQAYAAEPINSKFRITTSRFSFCCTPSTAFGSCRVWYFPSPLSAMCFPV